MLKDNPFFSQTEFQEILKAIGLLSSGGELFKDHEKKYHEVMAFLTHLLALARHMKKNKPLVLLDAGCGRSYLSFVLNAILTRKLERPAHFIGVDHREDLVEASRSVADELEFENMEFHAGGILEVCPSKKPDIIYALHACDTATDEALAAGIRLNARGIILVPCCQSYVGRHMNGGHPFSDISKHGVFRNHLTAMLTEGARTLALEAAGYKVKVITFIPASYTPKNVMIRALRQTQAKSRNSIRAYRNLTETFRFQSPLDRLLPEVFPVET